jgi:FkbM family methyltransferase
MRVVTAGPARFAVVDDKDSFWDRVEAGTWEPASLAAMTGLCGPGTTLVDIGAWVGPITLVAAALGAEVMAFEPDLRAFELLAANVAANPGFAERVEITRAALAPKAGRIRLGSPRKPGDSMGSVLFAGRGTVDWEADAITPAQAAERVAGAGRIVLKIDVEGAEYGLAGVLAPLLDRRTIAAMIAFHPRILKGAGVNEEEIERLTALAEAVFADFSARLLDEEGSAAPVHGTRVPRSRNSTMMFEVCTSEVLRGG